MNKIVRKIVIFLAVFIFAIALSNSKIYAATENQEQAFKDFEKQQFKTVYNLYLGESLDVCDWRFKNYLEIEVKSDNTAVANIYDGEIRTKQVGTANITMNVSLEDKKCTKKFKVNVTKTSESTKLDSNDNDVISITSYTTPSILLANSELWNTSDSFKITTKEAGNVSKYVYSSVYYMGLDSSGKEDLFMVKSILKKDGNLIVANAIEEVKFKNVKQENGIGHLKNNGNYYEYYIDSTDNNKLKTKKVFENVTALVGEDIIIKDGKTYARSGEKLFDFEVVAQNQRLLLNKKGELYAYYYDYKESNRIKKPVYKKEKVDTGVDSLLGNNVYKTKTGEIKKYIANVHDEDLVISNIYLWGTETKNGCNIIKLRANNKLYLNNVYILNNVDAIYEPAGGRGRTLLIVRKDGSIWKLVLGGEAKLTKVRTGKADAKRISEPTKITVTKVGKEKVKVEYNEIEGAEKYTIYRSNKKNGTYKKVGTSTTNSFEDKVRVGKTYYYKVVANYTNSKYNSKKSKPVMISIPKVPTKVNVVKKSTTSFNISYKKVSGATGYEIEYSKNKDFSKSKVKNTKNLSVKIKKLSKNKTYYVRVRAYQIINNEKVYSEYSNQYTIKLK